jgi:hypothetical protein
MSVPDLQGARLHDERTQLIADRVRAVRESGWGATFRVVQPRNLAFWVYLVLVAAGAFIMIRYIGSATAVYGTAVTMAVIVFALYGAVFWWFTQHIDRYAHQSRKLILLAFLWGAFGAILMASSANTPILSLWSKAFGASWASDWGAGLTAPFTEELSKGLGLLLLIELARRSVVTAFDGASRSSKTSPMRSARPARPSAPTQVGKKSRPLRCGWPLALVRTSPLVRSSVLVWSTSSVARPNPGG